MDRPEKRCAEQNTEANTTKCITNYIEHTTGCSMGLSGSNPEIQMQEKQFLFHCSCNLIKIFSVALIKANLWNMQNLSIISIWQMTRRFTSWLAVFLSVINMCTTPKQRAVWQHGKQKVQRRIIHCPFNWCWPQENMRKENRCTVPLLDYQYRLSKKICVIPVHHIWLWFLHSWCRWLPWIAPGSKCVWCLWIDDTTAQAQKALVQILLKKHTSLKYEPHIIRIKYGCRNHKYFQ